MQAVMLSLNSTGPTPTPTCPLGMRLSCNCVNVYTIVYHVQYMYMCKRAHPQRTSSRGKARVRTKVGPTSRRAERAASAAERPAAARAGHADFLATILARKSARKSVSVLWNLAIRKHDGRINLLSTAKTRVNSVTTTQTTDD